MFRPIRTKLSFPYTIKASQFFFDFDVVLLVNVVLYQQLIAHIQGIKTCFGYQDAERNI